MSRETTRPVSATQVAAFTALAENIKLEAEAIRPRKIMHAPARWTKK